MGRSKTTFTKGSKRASAAGQKSKRPPDVKVSVSRQVMNSLSELAPDVVQVLQKAVENAKDTGDVGAVLPILNKLVPAGVNDKLMDEAVSRELQELREREQELLQRLAELESPAKAVGK